jgi:hypothetical protein
LLKTLNKNCIPIPYKRDVIVFSLPLQNPVLFLSFLFLLQSYFYTTPTWRSTFTIKYKWLMLVTCVYLGWLREEERKSHCLKESKNLGNPNAYCEDRSGGQTMGI